MLITSGQLPNPGPFAVLPADGSPWVPIAFAAAALLLMSVAVTLVISFRTTNARPPRAALAVTGAIGVLLIVSLVPIASGLHNAHRSIDVLKSSYAARIAGWASSNYGVEMSTATASDLVFGSGSFATTIDNVELRLELATTPDSGSVYLVDTDGRVLATDIRAEAPLLTTARVFG